PAQRHATLSKPFRPPRGPLLLRAAFPGARCLPACGYASRTGLPYGTDCCLRVWFSRQLAHDGLILAIQDRRATAKAIHLPPKARFREDLGALRRRQGGAVETAAVRDSEARGDAAALRSAP